MSKKKKKHKKKHEEDSLMVFDTKMNGLHDHLIEELEEMQRYIQKKDKNAKKKKKKMMRNGVFSVFSPVNEMEEARLEVVNRMDRINLFDVLESVLKGIAPIVIVISRLVASLILLIFQLPIRNKIPGKVLGKMDGIYRMAMAIR